MEEKKNEIILFENQGVKLEVSLREETVWLTQAQMAELFDVKQSTLSEHINNIFKEGELEEKTSIGISDKSSGGRKSKLYNLDVIISVGYRVKSRNGVIFRKWATQILKDYMLKGYAINQKRLEYLEKTIKLIDIANRIDERLEGNDAKEILKVIGGYSKALNLLDDYDHRTLKKFEGNIDDSESYFAGENGTIIMCEHDYMNNFKRLGELKNGDIIEIQTNYGDFYYELYDEQIVLETETDKLPIQKNEEILMLYTCYNMTGADKTQYRYVVYAKKV